MGPAPRSTAALAAALAACLAPSALAAPPEGDWRKGALHAHANWGAPRLPTTSPDVVVRWHREHGYQFVSITDLNYAAPVEGLKALFDAPGRFLVVPGIELSADAVQPGDKIVDTVGIGLRRPVEPAAGKATVAETLDAQSAAVRRAGGLPIAAHPNLTYAVTPSDLRDSDKTAGPRFFEVWNSEPGMNNLGGGGWPSTEQLWDAALSAGRLVYGVAVDDSHHFHESGSSRRADERISEPGRAWVMVRSRELSVEALLEALGRGDFYASTGVTLETYEADTTGIRIRLSDRTRDLGWSAPGANPQLYRTEFVGRGGRVLKLDESLEPSYRFDGTELYVRARVVNSDGQTAWTQPIFPKVGERGLR